MFLRMSNTEKPDVATVDGNDVGSRLAFADKAESLLRRVLVALGYDNADKLTPMDLLTGITAWVSMLQFAKLDTFGRYAQTWWEAFKMFVPVFGPADSAQHATDAMNAFARMFPPTLSANEESERDTINDIAALSEELDKQTEIVAALVSEREAMLRANEHHASELATCRIQLEERTAQRDQLIRDVYGALVPLAKPASIEPGQRWAMIGTVIEYGDSETVATMQDGEWFNRNKMLDSAKWLYLGTDKV